VQTLALATRTALGPDAYVKTRAYWETFDNAIDMYDDAAQTKQYSASNAQHSEYADYALGGSVEVGKDFGTLDTLKGAVFYRRDNHSEKNQYFVDQYSLNQASTAKSATCLTSTTAYFPCFQEPRQVDIEDTYSIALENTYHLTPAVDLIEGASYDYRRIGQAQDYVLGSVSKGVYYSPYWVDYGSSSSQAVNAQGGVVWRYSETSKLFANISDRSRFPTLFELYSTRFGTAASNPGLMPERAINYQVGWTTAYAQGSQFSVDVYYADVNRLIQSVPTGGVYVDPISGAKSNITQNQNVGDGYRYGIDLAIDHYVNDGLTVGGNVSAIRSVVTNPTVPGFQLTGFPSLKGFVYANWLPIPSVTITPSLELANDNWTSKTISGVTTYFRTGAYALANVNAEFRVDAHLTVSAGVKNIFDQNYTPVWGYPAQGRNYYMVAKATF
jgi:iron complex outermembrane receptor protein